jgi:hypothetical protein
MLERQRLLSAAKLCGTGGPSTTCAMGNTLSVRPIVDEFNGPSPEERAEALDDLWERVRYNVYRITRGY